jgi:short-subunit dehydrogenase
MAALKHDFKDNVVVLTGASMGLGEQLAYQLADQGALLVLAARSANLLESVAEQCRKRGGQAVTVAADLMDEAQCKQVIERAVESFGRIDTLIYNAGRGWPGRFETLPNLDNLKNEITLNYLGLAHCTYYALPHLKRSRGRLIGVCSYGGLVAFPGTIGYNSSKHAMRGFLNTLRIELHGTGVSVTTAFIGALKGRRLEETMGKNANTIPTMSEAQCAAIIIRAGGRRSRQVITTLEGKVVTLLYQFIPALLDRQFVRLLKLYD